jgi:hypothetical protein
LFCKQVKIVFLIIKRYQSNVVVFNPGVSVDFLPQPSVVELPPELEQVEGVAEEIGVGNLEPVVLPTVL